MEMVVDGAECRNGDDGVVDVAVAAGAAGVAVVAWRAAEREDGGGLRALCRVAKDSCAVEGEVSGRQGGFVGRGADAGAHVEGVEAGAGEDVFWWGWIGVGLVGSGIG